jgi:tetratricopeptide (TPR) repeat protein
MKTKKLSDVEMAIKNFEKAIELDPKYASAYNGLGAAFIQADNLEAAIDAWKMAVKINPDLGFALYNLGLAFLRRGDKVSALDYLNRYKKREYHRLPPQEKDKLDALIQKCQQK